MKPSDVLFWLYAEPFRPFRITMNSGRTYDVRHPELVRLLRSSFLFFTPSEDPRVADRAERVGLNLITRIEPVDTPHVASP